jgi:predicted transcriptional regulator
MTDRPARIAGTISDAPGIHFNAIVRKLELAPGQVQYHLKGLIREGVVVAEPLYGRTHYYRPDYDADERGAIAVLRRETPRDIMFYLLERGPTDPSTVAADLDIARSTVEWHLDHLIEQGIVRKQRDSRNRVTLVLTRPTETVGLLEDIEPTLAGRFSDRFTRLVDHLLFE